MSFLKCSTLHISNFITTIFRKIKSQTMISNKQNLENEPFKVGFVLLKIIIIEKFKLKIKLTETKT